MSKWWYFAGDEKNGPYDEKVFAEVIKNKPLYSNTLVWTTGLEEWIRLSDIPQFSSFVIKNEIPPPVPVLIKRATSYSSAINPGLLYKAKKGIIGILAIATLAIACGMADKSTSQEKVFYTDKPLSWTNLDTNKTIGIPSGWKISATFNGKQRFTVLHEEMSGAEISIYHEKTNDDIHVYAADMMKIYPQRHIKISHSEFYKAESGVFWLANGEVDSEPGKIFDVAIHNKDGRMWIVSNLHPEWIETNKEWAEVVSAVNGTTL